MKGLSYEEYDRSYRKECDSNTGEEATGSHFNCPNFPIAASPEKTVEMLNTPPWKPAWCNMGQFHILILNDSDPKHS